MHQDRVQRVLHLVRHAARDAADGREPVGHLQLTAHLAGGFGIPQPHQQAGAPARIATLAGRLQNIHRKQGHECARAIPAGDGHPPIANGPGGLRRLCQHQPQRGVGRENLWQGAAHQVGAHFAQKLLDRAGSHYQAPIASEHQHRVFQLIEQPFEVAAQIGKIELRAAKLLTQQVHLGGHDAEFILAGAGDRLQGVRVVFARGHQVEHVAQPAQRTKGNDRKQQRDAKRTGHRRQRHAGTLLQGGYNIQRLNEWRIDDHAHIQHVRLARRSQRLLELVGGLLIQYPILCSQLASTIGRKSA